MTNAEKYRTAEARSKAFTKWCAEKQKTAIGKVAKHECSDCPLDEHTPCCFFYWLDLEAEDEKPLPCPFCGSPCVVVYNAVECANKDGCAYRCWQKGFGADGNVAAHNRFARTAMEAWKKEEK